MNPTTVKLALKAGKKAYGAFRDYREEKAAQAYEMMSEAADRYNEQFEDTKKDAYKVTQAMRSRFNELSDKLEDDTKDLSKRAKKQSKQLQKKAAASQKVAAKKAKELQKLDPRKKNKGKGKALVKNMTFFGLLLSVLAGLVYWFLLREQEQPGTQPPRVEEQNGSKLVHSTVTGEDEAEETQEK